MPLDAPDGHPFLGDTFRRGLALARIIFRCPIDWMAYTDLTIRELRVEEVVEKVVEECGEKDSLIGLLFCGGRDQRFQRLRIISVELNSKILRTAWAQNHPS
jgi:hypothetical protein